MLLFNVNLLAQKEKFNLDIGVGVSYLHSELQTVSTYGKEKQEFTQVNSNLLAKYRTGLNFQFCENEFVTISTSLGVLSTGFKLKYRDEEMINQNFKYRRNEAYTDFIIALSPFRTKLKTREDSKNFINTDLVILLGCDVHYFLYSNSEDDFSKLLEVDKLYLGYNLGLGFKIKRGEIRYRFSAPFGSNFEASSIFENSLKLQSHILTYLLPLKK